MSYKQYLEDIYFNPSHPAALTSPEKLYKVVKKEGKYNISRNKIKQWLQTQDEYTKHRAIKRKFNRRRTVVSGVDNQWGIDLASVQNISQYNDGVVYLLVVIDVFSKFLFVEPLKNKKAKDVLHAFDKILSHGRSPDTV